MTRPEISTRTPTSQARERETFADAGEIDALAEQLARFERGELDAEAWRAYRVARGLYGQRQEGVYMLRVKLPQGAVHASQLRGLADVATRHARGFGHVTTRQNLQLHFVKPAAVVPALRRLAATGITTSGAGGNAVRNVVACPLAGVSPTELFDVTPYAEAVTRHFLRHPLGSSLPRKLKIAFEGCAHDHVATAIQDLGFRAREHAGVRGFSVTVAGGTASLCTAGQTLVELLPAGEVLALCEAVVRVFHARGDRVNKQRNRLKFLVAALGFETFRALVAAELERVRAEGIPALPFDPERPPVESAPRPPGPGAPPPRRSRSARHGALEAFLATQVLPQRQEDFSVVVVSLPQGDVTAPQLTTLADLATAHGDGTVRFGAAGHVLLRWIATEEVPAVLAGLASAGLAREAAGTAADVVACPGADVCRSAVTRTREIARAIETAVREKVGRPALAAPLAVRMSGCPNGCSQHHLAAIGLQGGARKLGGRAVPQVAILLGGEVGEDGIAFAKLAGKVPARRAPDAVARLVALYLAERVDGEAAGRFYARAFDRAKGVIGAFEQLRLEDTRPEDFVELGAEEDFRPQVQEGECAA
jgi:sulfite reductase beta subunit-like hemoprotein